MRNKLGYLRVIVFFLYSVPLSLSHESIPVVSMDPSADVSFYLLS
jgi:hypothetical protein